MIPVSRPARTRKVCGTLFADYVKMIRGYHRYDWSRYLKADDLAIFDATILPSRWYPMEAYERLGIAILHVIADDQFNVVHAWGRVLADQMVANLPEMLVDGDPATTIQRYHEQRKRFFSFDPVMLVGIDDRCALVDIDFGMRQVAEAAACFQTMGFFERLVELAGRRQNTRFAKRSWEGDQHTVLEVRWSTERRMRTIRPVD